MPLLRLIPMYGTPVTVTKETAVVGREPGCDVYVNDGSVSRRHANLELRRGAWFVIDQRSANGTFLDSQRVSDALLRSGQEVRFGMVTFRVEIQEGAEGTVMAAPGYPPGPVAPGMAPPPAAPPPPIAYRPVAPGAPPSPGAPPPPIAYRPVAPGAPPPAPGAPHRVGPPYVVPPPPPPPARAPGLPPPRPPGAPTAAPPLDEIGPAPKEGRGPLLWIALGCGGTLLVVVVLIVIAVGGVFLWTRAPVQAAEAYLGDIRRGDLAAAHARLSEAYKTQVSRETMEAFVARHPALKESATVGFNSRSVHNDTADLAGRLATATGTAEEMSMHLVQEGGAWKVGGLEVAGDRLEGKQAGVASGELKVESGEVQKRRDGNVIKVAIKVNVGGFQVRPEGDRFGIDLAEDVETIGPSGERIEALSRADVQRFKGSTSFERGAVAALSTPLILDQGSAPGEYRVKVTVRDLVGGGQASHEVTFQVP